MFGDGALGYRVPDEPLVQNWLDAFAHGAKAILVQGGFRHRWSFVEGQRLRQAGWHRIVVSEPKSPTLGPFPRDFDWQTLTRFAIAFTL